MPSRASRLWSQYVGDPKDMIVRLGAELRQVGAVDPGGLYRAGVVALVAAWERSVEELAKQIVESRPRQGAWKTRKQRVLSMVRTFSTPSAENVERLLHAALDADPWHGVAAGGLTEVQTRLEVNKHLVVRHTIAHGTARPIHDLQRLMGGVTFFDELVAQVDARARSVLTIELGHAPW